jgi:hypothetical protein
MSNEQIARQRLEQAIFESVRDAEQVLTREEIAQLVEQKLRDLRFRARVIA